MKKTFLLIIIFLFSFQKLLNAVDFGNYLAGESANAKKENKLAINYFKNAIDLDNLDTEYSKDVAKKLCNLYLLEGEINNCISIGRKIEKNLTSKTIESTNILMALIIGDIKDKNLGSAMNRIKKIRKSSYERFSVPIIEAWLISENDNNLKKAKDKLNELEQDLIVDGLRNLNLALILEYFDKNDDALIYYQKSINSFVQPSYRLVQISANAFERNRDFKKSKDIYIKFLNNSNDYLLIEEELKRIEKKKITR